MKRFFIKSENIYRKVAELNKEQSVKLIKVLRSRVGDYIEIFDEHSNVFLAELTYLSLNGSKSKIIEVRDDTGSIESSSEFILAQSLPKNLKIEFVLQKSTELGVSRIILFTSERSVVKVDRISKNKIVRWEKIVVEASQQCGRKTVPEITVINDGFNNCLDYLEQIGATNYLCDIHGSYISDILGGKKTSPSIDFMERYHDTSNLTSRVGKSSGNDKNRNVYLFLVGPEGGFSTREISLIESKLTNLVKIKLAQYTLRSETSCLVFLSQMQLFV